MEVEIQSAHIKEIMEKYQLEVILKKKYNNLNLNKNQKIIVIVVAILILRKVKRQNLIYQNLNMFLLDLGIFHFKRVELSIKSNF